MTANNTDPVCGSAIAILPCTVTAVASATTTYRLTRLAAATIGATSAAESIGRRRRRCGGAEFVLDYRTNTERLSKPLGSGPPGGCQRGSCKPAPPRTGQ